MNLLKNTFFKKIMFLIFLCPFLSNGQTTESNAQNEIKYPQFKVQGLFQARYLSGFKEGIDATTGLQHTDGNAVENTFDIKRMRLGLTTKLSEGFDIVVLANLADFKSDPKGKVLENAFARYTFNKNVGVLVGQFRPAFGLEELNPADILKSFDYSNQYTEFGNNGWTSFQIGASLFGGFTLGKLPVTYAFSAVNGNGKDQVSDKDNGKQYSSRLAFELNKKHNINFGLNGGTGEVFNHKVFAVAVDLTADFKLADKLKLQTQLEVKQGTNHHLYYSLAAASRTNNINDYEMRGGYFLPNLRYEIKYQKLTAIEFSCRYEYFDRSFKINSNARQTYTPMAGLEFGKGYTGRIEMGMQLDTYKHNIPNTTSYDNNLFIIQFQGRFF
ncbi:phosphate-selective porin O/P [Flavobacterium araucananum]|uniref:Porin n=1 Tax=Flavobacterium araucananum TaxID=946678 RepID=A0A227P4K1_9FLAO|nr:porin [Flavobacterium araucananum]OXG04453.1 porin [Flavobacterium araucananum]PWJ96955.1 phosphate-selective porin O/P [Flavobacterium araucananum]